MTGKEGEERRPKVVILELGTLGPLEGAKNEGVSARCEMKRAPTTNQAAHPVYALPLSHKEDNKKQGALRECILSIFWGA